MRLLHLISSNALVGITRLFVTIVLIAIFLLTASPSLSQTSSGQGEARAPAEPGGGKSVVGTSRLFNKSKGSPRIESLENLDIAALIRECDINGGLMRRQMFNFTYTLKKIRRSLNDSGKTVDEEAQVFEAYPVRGEHVLIQLSKNGVALPPWRIMSERKRAGEQLVKAESEEKNRTEKGEPDSKEERGYVSAGISGKANDGKHAWITIDISYILLSSDFSSPRIEQYGDRRAIALDFRPRDKLSFPLNRRYIPKLVGTVWIDADEKTVAKLEARLAPQLAKDADNQGVVLVFEQQRQPTGEWFPSLIRMNANGNTDLFNGLNWDVSFEFSEYKQFTSKADNVVIKETKKANQ